MGKPITAKGIAGPDFGQLVRFLTRTVVSNKDTQFTSALGKNATEQENLTGLVSSRIKITRITIKSSRPLFFRLHLFSKDTFTNSDLNVDSYVGSVDLDLSTYGRKVV